MLPPVSNAAAEQFARTPYAVSFKRGEVEFILTTVHIVWDRPTDRIPETTAFAEWMRKWATREDDWNGNQLVLGDFNMEGAGTVLYQALVSTGLFPPCQLSNLPRTIFDDPEKPLVRPDRLVHPGQRHRHHRPPQRPGIHPARWEHRLRPHTFTGMNKTELSWRISDPTWSPTTFAFQSESLKAAFLIIGSLATRSMPNWEIK